MTKKEYQKFKRDIKPVIHILDNSRRGFASRIKPVTEDQWKLIASLHRKYIKGSNICEDCGKIMKTCNDLNRLRND